MKAKNDTIKDRCAEELPRPTIVFSIKIPDYWPLSNTNINILNT